LRDRKEEKKQKSLFVANRASEQSREAHDSQSALHRVSNEIHFPKPKIGFINFGVVK
jgi:hypothetical protein